jgi:hypothetical protein
MPARVLLFTLLFAAPLVARADDLIELLQQRNCPDCLLNEFGAWTIAIKDQISDQLANGFPLQRHTIKTHTIGPGHNALLPTATLIPTTGQASVVHRDQNRLDIHQPSPSQAQCRELRQLTKSRQWHTTLPTGLMLSTMARLNHSLSETFKGATSSR